MARSNTTILPLANAQVSLGPQEPFRIDSLRPDRGVAHLPRAYHPPGVNLVHLPQPPTFTDLTCKARHRRSRILWLRLLQGIDSEAEKFSVMLRSRQSMVSTVSPNQYSYYQTSRYGADKRSVGQSHVREPQPLPNVLTQ
jgi:hypothetical protein